MLCRFLMLVCILSTFVVLQNSVHAQRAQVPPLEFVQRNDVGNEINIAPAQRVLVDRLKPICDAQCEARIMEMFTSVSTDLQSQFLALTPDQQQVAVQTLDQNVRESIEMDMLEEAVLNEAQMTRLQQLRMQFLGLDSLLTDRVRTLMGITSDQARQIREIQNFGGELTNSFGQDFSLSPALQQAGIGNIQNVLNDQSINILNGAQIEIFINLCGQPCNFEMESNRTEPADGAAGASNPSSSGCDGGELQSGGDEIQAGTTSQGLSLQRSSDRMRIEPMRLDRIRLDEFSSAGTSVNRAEDLGTEQTRRRSRTRRSGRR